MDEGYQKAILSLVSVFVGWTLGLGTGVFQKWWNNRRLKKSLFIELEDLHSWLNIVHEQLARTLQIYSIKGVDNSIPLKLTHPIYTNYYKDIFHKLNRDQRRSYELIHEHINSFNESIERQGDFHKIVSKEPNEKNLETWGGIIKSQYLHLREIMWHLTYHINNSKNPKLDIYSEAHKKYLLDCDRYSEEMNLIIEKAKSFKPEDLEKPFDRKNFELGKRNQ